MTDILPGKQNFLAIFYSFFFSVPDGCGGRWSQMWLGLICAWKRDWLENMKIWYLFFFSSIYLFCLVTIVASLFFLVCCVRSRKR